MYAETQLCGKWVPSRVLELDIEFMMSTIIFSPFAEEMDLIGLDLRVPKERTRLMVEPEGILRDASAQLYGPTGKTNRHRRRISALPDTNPEIPIDPKEEFVQISDVQIDTLDHSIGKLMQRAGKIDVTWRRVTEDMGTDIVVYMQQVEDGTIRFQAKGEFNLSIEEVEKYVTNPELEMQFWQKNDINLQLVELFNENFWIVREFWDRSSMMIAPRDSILYCWFVKQDDVIYKVTTSVDEDEDHAELRDGYIRKIHHPGCGYIFRKIGENRVEWIAHEHQDFGGWVPLFLVKARIPWQFRKFASYIREIERKLKTGDLPTQINY